MSQKALILVDFEKEWVDQKSNYFVGNISPVIKKVNRLIKFCRQQQYKIIFTKHIEKDSLNAFTKGSKNVEFIDEIEYNNKDIVVTKYKISPFHQTTLAKHLKGVKQLVVCGILTNLCIRSLIEEAYDREFEITVIKDCCVAFDKVTQDFTFKDLKATREEVEFVNLNKFLNS